MRLRAAFLATLLNLIVCALFLAVCSVTAADLQNEIIEEEMRITCRLSTEMLDSAAFQDSLDDRKEYLQGIITEGDIHVAYYASDSKLVYQNFDYPSTPPTLEELAGGGECTFERVRPDGVELICVSKILKDGSTLCYSKPASTWLSSLGSYQWVFVLIILAAVLMQFIIVVRTVGMSDSMVESIMKVLEDFTEGRFDSRITGVAAASQTVAAKYNATLARVQDRVFRQQRRNRIVGQVLNQMQNGLITVDTDLRLTFTTATTGELFGVYVKDFESENLSTIFHCPELENAFREVIKEGFANVQTKDIDIILPNGKSRPLRLYASTLHREGKCTGALGVIEDITKLRNLEQMRTDFAANVSHEMKTPLTSIKGFVETLQAGAIEKPETARKFLDIMMIEADRLTRLINDILSITKLESGQEDVEIKPIALDRAVTEVCELLKIHASEKDVKINSYVNPHPAYVMGNPDRVKQLLINLIENGIKYNKNGGSVTVKVMEDEKNVNLIVSDTGIGIRSENLPRLFERFYRVDKGRSRAMGGTGLGLAIVKHITNTMSGMIEVHSKYGEGTEFLVTLPRAPESETAAAPEQTEQSDGGENT